MYETPRIQQSDLMYGILKQGCKIFPKFYTGVHKIRVRQKGGWHEPSSISRIQKH